LLLKRFIIPTFSSASLPSGLCRGRLVPMVKPIVHTSFAADFFRLSRGLGRRRTKRKVITRGSLAPIRLIPPVALPLGLRPLHGILRRRHHRHRRRCTAIVEQVRAIWAREPYYFGSLDWPLTQQSLPKLGVRWPSASQIANFSKMLL
jgi:hypothetical protein